MKSFLKYISKKHKSAHKIAKMDTPEVDVSHANNMKTLAIIEIIGSAIQPILTTHYKRIELIEAAITAPDEHKVDQSVAYTLFASHYDKQVHTQFHDYLRPMLTNIPLHSYVYDNTQLYMECPIKRRMYRMMVTQPQYRYNLSDMPKKIKTLYQLTWVQTKLVSIEANKLLINSAVVNAPRIFVDLWKRHDKRHLPP